MFLIETGEKLVYFLKYKQDLTKRLSETFPLSKCLAKSEGEEMVGELNISKLQLNVKMQPGNWQRTAFP